MSFKIRLNPKCSKWLFLASLLHLIVALFMSESLMKSVVGQSLPRKNSVIMPPPTKYNTLTTKEALQRRLMKDREVIPPLNSNAISGEPSCEELRAMWRYYKRQSRAELTNEIPRFGSNLFWDILPNSPQQPQISSFGTVKGRSKAQRLRLKTQKNPVYGQVMFKQEKERDRSRKPRPMDEVAKLMGKSSKSEQGKMGGTSQQNPEPIVHLSPPPSPTKESSLQKIKEVFREERIREKGPSMRQSDDNGKAFGRIILSPPRGMDGRVANKPRELMTPFEKIRFGHADDIFDLDDSVRPKFNLMAKRRTLPLPVLKYQQQKGRQFLSFTRNSRGDFDDAGFYGQPFDMFSDVHPSQQDLLFEETPIQFLDASSLNDYQGRNTGQDDKSNSNMYWAPLIQNEGSNNEMGYPFGNTNTAIQEQEEIYQYPISDAPNLMEIPLTTCKEMEGESCNVNTDCSCIGFGLYRCFANECQVLSLHPSVGVLAEKSKSNPSDSEGDISGQSTGYWHGDPLQSNQLGVWEDSTRTELRDSSKVPNNEDNNNNNNNNNPEYENGENRFQDDLSNSNSRLTNAESKVQN